MPLLEYAAEAFIGTTVMTAFSYLISASFKKLFSEPALINYVVSLSKIQLKPRLGSVLGWIVHYAIGTLFVIAYHLLWMNGFVGETLVWALVLACHYR